MRRGFLTIFVTLMLCAVCFGQHSRPELFIPSGFSLLDSASGDFNLDGYRDVVMVLKSDLEKSVPDTIRPLLLMFGTSDGRYKVVARNDSVVLCLSCGGVFGDPYVGITVKDRYFSIEHYGGSSWRWTRIITFKYDKASKYFVLHRDAGYSWHTFDPDKQTEQSYMQASTDVIRFDKYSNQ